MEKLWNYHRLLLDHMHDRVSFVDPSYRYVAVNQAYVRAFERPYSEIIGRPVWELLGEEVFHKSVKPHLDRAFAGEEVEYEAWFSSAGSKRNFMTVRYKPVYEEKRLLGAVVTVNDLTEKKLLIETNRVQGRLVIQKSKMAKLGEMVAFLTHQIRQPLHTITTSFLKMHVLLENREYDLFPQLLAENEKKMDFLLHTIDSIQSYYGSETRPKSLIVRRIIEDALLIVEQQFRIDSIAIELECDENIEVFTIANKLMHVLLVLLNNAQDASANTVRIRVAQKGEIVTIAIEDDGSGIAPLTPSDLFVPGKSSKEEPNHGYGLYLAKQIMQRELYGDIAYVATTKGAQFIVKLPHSK